MKQFFAYTFFLFFLFYQNQIDGQVDPSDPTLSPEERKKIIQYQENRWEIGKSSTTPNFTSLGFSILKPFVVLIHNDLDSIVTTNQGDLRLKIPTGAFPKSTKIEVRITVLRKHFDYLFAGIPTQLGPNQSPNILLESTGMFYLAFFNENGQRIEPKKSLTVELASLTADPSNSNVYRFSNGNWKLVASEINSNTQSNANDKNLDEDQAKLYPIQASPNIEESMNEGFQFQIYSKIQSSGWWNFDIPKPEFTCITGKIKNNNFKNLNIQAIGIDYFGTSYGNVDASGNFYLNVLKDQNVKVLVTRFSTNPSHSKEIGFLPTFRTQNITAHTSASPSKCQNVSEIGMIPIPEDAIKDRSKFLKIIDMPDI
ncbi:hypothetical protein AB3N59_11690 [Leptospira sp. WS92.C1]